MLYVGFLREISSATDFAKNLLMVNKSTLNINAVSTGVNKD